jgi:hypothetical protein
VEDLTLDQLLVLIMSEKKLERIGSRRQTTVQELRREGVLPYIGTGSLVQRLRARARAEARDHDRVGKRARRQQRREALIAYLRERQEHGDP